MCVFEFLCDFSMHCPDVYFILSSCIWLMNERVIWVCSALSSITYAPQLYFFWCVKFCCELKPVLLLVKFNKWRKLLFIYKPILAWLNSAHNGFINYKYFGGFNLLGNYWVVIQIDWFYYFFFYKKPETNLYPTNPASLSCFFPPSSLQCVCDSWGGGLHRACSLSRLYSGHTGLCFWEIPAQKPAHLVWCHWDTSWLCGPSSQPACEFSALTLIKNTQTNCCSWATYLYIWIPNHLCLPFA